MVQAYARWNLEFKFFANWFEWSKYKRVHISDYKLFLRFFVGVESVFGMEIWKFWYTS
jgi:hypothetical protein